MLPDITNVVKVNSVHNFKFLRHNFSNSFGVKIKYLQNFNFCPLKVRLSVINFLYSFKLLSEKKLV
jgi:hypothetical protein